MDIKFGEAISISDNGLFHTVLPMRLFLEPIILFLIQRGTSSFIFPNCTGHPPRSLAGVRTRRKAMQPILQRNEQGCDRRHVSHPEQSHAFQFWSFQLIRVCHGPQGGQQQVGRPLRSPPSQHIAYFFFSRLTEVRHRFLVSSIRTCLSLTLAVRAAALSERPRAT